MRLLKRHKNRLNDKGSVLISLIITMVVLAALGAAMVSLTSTAMFGQVGANSSARAYFIAESGYRYAESRYMRASDESAKDAELEAMHDSNWTLLDNAGQFNLKTYPYYFKVLLNPVGTATLSAKVPGGFPAGMTLAGGRLKIGTKASNIYSYNSVAQAGQNVTFNMAQTLPYFPAGTDVLPVARSGSLSQSINEGGTLLLQAGSAEAFPSRNGTFQVNGRVYAYATNDLANNRLLGITDPEISPMAALTLPANSELVLRKFLELHATGIVGQGAAEGAASREVVYRVPLPSAALERKEFKEGFEDLADWNPATVGTFAIQTIGGDQALRVTGTEALGGAPKASLIRFDPSALNIDLAAAHLYGDPYYLSYDVQVKVGFDAVPTPDYGFNPIPIPVYYAAGLLFRLDNANNSYGLSFLRGSNNTAPTPDNIDNGIVPQDQKSLIVLWQQTDSGTTTKWLAYKDVNVFFSDDVESGENGWSAAGLWHRSTRRAHGPTGSWYYGQEASGNYNTGVRNSGALISPDISLCEALDPALTFWSWYQTEPDNPGTPINEANEYDKKYVEISTNGGTTWVALPLNSPLNSLAVPANPMNSWQQISIPLSAYSGQKIKIRFRFDTIDAVNNSYEGWYVDDIKVSGTSTFALNEATLVVRVKEAASITFSSGGPVEVLEADTVVGQSSGARGIVSEAPIIESGSWGGNTAAGNLLLRNTAGTFVVGEQIKIVGSQATAQVDGLRARDNFVRAYYGDQNGCGTPDDDPLDAQRGGVPRSIVRWPPDALADWSAADDYFTLVQWDAVNTGVTLLGSKNEPSAIIRDNTLTSPAAGPLVEPELGLHAFGKGAANVYFDDFAVQADVGSSGAVGFSGVIQE